MRQRGLTLVEILLAAGISGVVGALLLAVIVSSAGLFYKESSRLQEGLNINDTLSRVREVVKQSSTIVSSYNNGPITYISGSTQLVLKVPSQDSSNNIIADTFDYFVFFLDDKKMRFKTFPDSLSSRKAQDQIFSTLVENLSFKYLNLANPPTEVAPVSAKKIRISLTLKQKAGASFETNVATSEANLRND